jgi:hypothetical protein
MVTKSGNKSTEVSKIGVAGSRPNARVRWTSVSFGGSAKRRLAKMHLYF